MVKPYSWRVGYAQELVPTLLRHFEIWQIADLHLPDGFELAVNGTRSKTQIKHKELTA